MIETGSDAGQRLRGVLADVLALPAERAAMLDHDTALFGAMPELDSIAVAGLLTAVEDSFGIVIEDDEVDGDMLATFGSLLTFIRTKTRS